VTFPFIDGVEPVRLDDRDVSAVHARCR
jgi:hypothetical protein